ncbi:rhodanese-like domain-containing protein [Rhodovibrionaceae bacterium A322]
MAMKRGYKALLAEAEQEITRLTVAEAQALLDDDGVVLVDIRDIRELKKLGKIPGAVHAPRGMLEFWIDPESPYHREVFAQDKRYVFFCAAGWRSALATKTAQDMGLEPVADIIGGFSAWVEAGAPVDAPES